MRKGFIKRRLLILVSVLLIVMLSLIVIVNFVNTVHSLKSYSLAAIIQNSNSLFIPANSSLDMTQNLPTPRAGAVMAFDPTTGQDILFGGASSLAGGGTGIGVFGDTWSYNGSEWTLLHPLASPSARAFAAMTTSSSQGLVGIFKSSTGASNNSQDLQGVILFGGMSPSGALLSDTWMWNGTNWIQKHPITTPPPRDFAAMSIGPSANGKFETIMYGGLGNGNTLLSDTWMWNGTNWIQEHPKTSPPPLAGASLALGPSATNLSQAVGSPTNSVLFGGLAGSLSKPEISNQTWIWNGTNWIQEHPITSPPPRLTASFSIAPIATPNNAPLESPLVTIPASAPISRYSVFTPADGFETSIPNQEKGRFDDLLFGGLAGPTVNLTNSLSDSWIWNGTNWIQQHPILSPPSLGLASMSVSLAPKPKPGYLNNSNSLNSANNNSNQFAIVLFGGQESTGLGLDEFTWDGRNWIQAGLNTQWYSVVNISRSVLAAYDHISITEVGVTPIDPRQYGIEPVAFNSSRSIWRQGMQPNLEFL